MKLTTKKQLMARYTILFAIISLIVFYLFYKNGVTFIWGAKGQDGILGKKLEIYYDENEVENRELVDVDNGFGWNSEDDADFFNEFYYRYKIDSIEIIISLLAIIIVYLFMAAKVIKIVFEIVMGNIIAIYILLI